jgi:hypothetical protein
LEPAVQLNEPLATGWIHYQLQDGDVGKEVCYWGDMIFVPHLLNLLSKRRIQASVRFGKVERMSTNRKELARQLHSEVVRLKEGHQLLLDGPKQVTPSLRS